MFTKIFKIKLASVVNFVIIISKLTNSTSVNLTTNFNLTQLNTNSTLMEYTQNGY